MEHACSARSRESSHSKPEERVAGISDQERWDPETEGTGAQPPRGVEAKQHEHPGSGPAYPHPPPPALAQAPDSPGPRARGGAPGPHLALRAAHTRLPPFIFPPRGSGRRFPNWPGDARASARASAGCGAGGRGRRQVGPPPGEARPARRFASSRSVATPAGRPRRGSTSVPSTCF